MKKAKIDIEHDARREAARLWASNIDEVQQRFASVTQLAGRLAAEARKQAPHPTTGGAAGPVIGGAATVNQAANPSATCVATT